MTTDTDLIRALQSASTCLAAAGGILINNRQTTQGPEAHAMISAMRDDITEMIRNVELVRKLSKS